MSKAGGRSLLFQIVFESQWGRLVGHFFRRFFDNDLTSAQEDFRVTVIEIFAILATPGLLISFYTLLVKYSRLSHGSGVLRRAELISDEFLFLTVSMVIMGFTTVLVWERLFPDRLDYTMLLVLPVSLGTLFSAKITSLLLFLGLCTLAINSFTTVLFPLLGADPGGDMTAYLRFAGAHTIAVLLGNTFVFALFITLKGLLMSVLPARAFVRVSRGFQLILLAALVLLFLTFPVLFPSINVMLSEQNSLMLCFPPSWFLGLYELLLGYSGETFTSLGRLAGLGLAALATSSLALYGFAYGRHVSRTLESRELSPSHCLPVFASLASSIRLVRNLREMAVFQFLCQTLGRSQRHRLILTVCFGFGLALIFTALVQLSLGRADPTVSLCSIPLILSFVTLAGLRISFTLPAMLSANWIFQISESESNDRSLLAVWKLMVLGGILPCLLLVPLYLYLWPPKQVALQLTFVSVLSLVLIEFLLFNFRKIPYTCAYLPGKSNLKLMWVVYLGLFSTYAYSMASLEAWLFDHPAYFGLFLAISALLAVSLFLRRHTILRGARLVYKEESVPPVQPLVLKR